MQNSSQKSDPKNRARQIGTRKMDVIFDKSVSSSILNIFSQMILGEQIIASNSCFKPEDIGKKIFNKAIEIEDDPYKKGGQRSE